MDGIKVRALVCGSQNYKENDKLLTLCSVEEGKITALLKGCRKPTSKLRFAHAPFCFGEYLLSERNGYYTITGCTPIEQFTDLSSDIDKFYAGSVILEMLKVLTEEGDNLARPLAKALEHLKILCYEECNPSLVLLSFISEFLRIAGYSLNFSRCCVCRTENMNKRYFSHAHGGLVCPICAGQNCEIMSAQATGLLRAVTNGIPLNVLKFEDCVVRECLVLLYGYLSNVAGRGLNSLKQYLDISKLG